MSTYFMFFIHTLQSIYTAVSRTNQISWDGANGQIIRGILSVASFKASMHKMWPAEAFYLLLQAQFVLLLACFRDKLTL